MIKILLIFVLAGVGVWGQIPSRCQQTCRIHTREICASENRGVSCHRISSCHFERENCRRSQNRRPLLTHANWSSCRELTTPYSSGSCARRIRRPRSPESCRNRRCVDTSQRTACYRSKRNNCQLLTNCQQQQVNCHRGYLNRVERSDPRQCAGMRVGQTLQPCKPIPRRG